MKIELLEIVFCSMDFKGLCYQESGQVFIHIGHIWLLQFWKKHRFSHKLHQIKALCDITVYKQIMVAITLDIKQATISTYKIK